MSTPTEKPPPPLVGTVHILSPNIGSSDAKICLGPQFLINTRLGHPLLLFSDLSLCLLFLLQDPS